MRKTAQNIQTMSKKESGEQGNALIEDQTSFLYTNLYISYQTSLRYTLVDKNKKKQRAQGTEHRAQLGMPFKNQSVNPSAANCG